MRKISLSQRTNQKKQRTSVEESSLQEEQPDERSSHQEDQPTLPEGRPVADDQNHDEEVQSNQQEDLHHLEEEPSTGTMGGPCHHTGGGAPPYQTNTRARGNPSQNKSRRNQTSSNNKNIKSGNNPISTEVPVIAVLFVDQTAGGELARRLQEAETRLGKMTGYRIRITETSGSQLCRVLPNTNPWAGGDCGRVGCYTMLC